MPRNKNTMSYADRMAQLRAEEHERRIDVPPRFDLIDRDTSTLTGPERMDRARAVAARETAMRQAEAAATDGIARAAAKATEKWKRDAYDFLMAYLVDHARVFVDDLWEAGLPHTDDDRALGALFRVLAGRGFMVKTGEFRKSTRSNSSEKPVWRSTIYKPA